MGQNRKGKDARERVVCFCYNVPESVIIEAIRGGCQSLMDIRRETYASTGCAGCSEEVKKLLRKYVPHSGQGPEGGTGGGEPDPGKLGHG
jgi:NAD(P)H-nitrite reductase large subunit